MLHMLHIRSAIVHYLGKYPTMHFGMTHLRFESQQFRMIDDTQPQQLTQSQLTPNNDTQSEVFTLVMNIQSEVER